MKTAPVSDTFQKLFESSQAASPTYQGRLANHLPMTLIAMQRLGASDQQMERFYAHYLSNLEFPEQPNPQQIHYLGTIHNSTTANVLVQALAQHAEGICASAFHALIRIGYSLLIDQPLELSIALAFLESEYQSLGQLASPTPSTHSEQHGSILTFHEIIRHIKSSPELSQQTLAAPNIIVRLNKAVELPAFQEIIHQVDQSYPTLATLAHFNRALYLATGDFTALHGMTSCHALRVIFNYLEKHQALNSEKVKTQLLRYYALALAALYITIKTPDFAFLTDQSHASPESTLQPTIPSWDNNKQLHNINTSQWNDVIKHALTQNDDHDIKFTFTCYDEYLTYHHRDYYDCALKRLKLER